ncbi:isoprenoid biosynthesis glyoxalase ElbB [bacterium]|nr:isoprenoid biosynthesis glyoxalase ElbB [bacterium]
MTKIGVVLSGCGVFDGSEIHEAVAVLLALSRAGVQYRCLAPDMQQMHVVNHFTGEVSSAESRNVLHESARIARGDVVSLGNVTATDFDGYVFPGGFGAAKNLSNFAVAGGNCEVNEQVSRLVRDAHSRKIPMAFLCISPVIAGRLLAGNGVQVTIGDDDEAMAAFDVMGATHVICQACEMVRDEDNLVISSPAYMKADNIAEVFDDITQSVNALLEMVSQRQSVASDG